MKSHVSSDYDVLARSPATTGCHKKVARKSGNRAGEHGTARNCSPSPRPRLHQGGVPELGVVCLFVKLNRCLFWDLDHVFS